MILAWRDHPDKDFSDRLASVCSAWSGTPYINGQRVKGKGADCMGFALPAMAELLGLKEVVVPRMAPHTAYNQKKRTFAVICAVKRQFPMFKRIHTNIILPGDILIARIVNNPGHIMIVSESCNMVWHSDYKIGVKKTAVPYLLKLYGIWRLKTWL